jgi:hypothetical protein
MIGNQNKLQKIHKYMEINSLLNYQCINEIKEKLKSILRQMRMETTYQHMDAARKV